MNVEKTREKINRGMLYVFIGLGIIGSICLAIDFITTPFRFAADGFELGMIWLTYWSLKKLHIQYKAGGWV